MNKYLIPPSLFVAASLLALASASPALGQVPPNPRATSAPATHASSHPMTKGAGIPANVRHGPGAASPNLKGAIVFFFSDLHAGANRIGRAPGGGDVIIIAKNKHYSLGGVYTVPIVGVYAGPHPVCMIVPVGSHGATAGEPQYQTPGPNTNGNRNGWGQPIPCPIVPGGITHHPRRGTTNK